MCKTNFKTLKDAPVSVKVMYATVFLFGILAMVLLIMNIFEIGDVQLKVPMAFVVTAQIINMFGIRKYNEQINK